MVFLKIEDQYILIPMAASATDVESIINLNETGAVVNMKGGLEIRLSRGSLNDTCAALAEG